MDLTTKYRPKRFNKDEFIGNTLIINRFENIYEKADEDKQAFLFYGESGTGKTSTARLVAMQLLCQYLANGKACGECQDCLSICEDGSHPDVIEVDAADVRGIDSIRELKKSLSFSSLTGNKYKIVIFDEAHGLTKDSQNALLKIVEEPPPGVFIILCSTEPNKIIKTLRNRCESFEFKPVKSTLILGLLKKINTQEGFEIDDTTLEKLSKSVNGLPRNAVIRLQQLGGIKKEDRTVDCINEILGSDFDSPAEIINLCRVLTKDDPNKTWATIVEAYKKVKDYDSELIRLSVAGYLRSILERAVSSFNTANKVALALEMVVDPLPPAKPENKLVLALFKTYLILKGYDARRN